jgi:signal transduction histidine kinase
MGICPITITMRIRAALFSEYARISSLIVVVIGTKLFALIILTILAPMAVAATAQDELKVGFGQIVPLHYTDEQGRAAGFVVDVLNEAAKREGIQIVWKRVAGSNDIEPALEQRRIDIFPAGLATEARQARFSVSEPWWFEDLSILARADIGTGLSINWQGRRIVLPSRAYVPFASRVVPGARFNVPAPYEQRQGPEKMAALICNGSADAALLSHTEVDNVLVRRPELCRAGMDLQVLETNESLPLAIISQWATRDIAIRLRNRIDELAIDGSLAAIAGRYPRTPSRSALMLAEILRSRYQKRVLWLALAGSLFVLAITSVLLLRQIRVQRALRRAMVEQELTDRFLRDRTEDLTASNEELQAFAYSISHDLHEPLRMISLYAQIFERRCPPTSQMGHQYLAVILGAVNRMQEMMDKLLLLSRVGRSDVERHTAQVDDLLSNVLRDLEPVIRSTSAEIVIGPMPTITGWPDRLSVLFQNLISNALKYHRDDVAPHIEISAVQQDGEWCFAVRDNGIGFNQEYAEKIFGVFKRLHADDKYGGTGVGLAIARKVVERHGGRIWAEGNLNIGSTFYFTLPMQPVQGTAKLVTSRAGSTGEHS